MSQGLVEEDSFQGLRLECRSCQEDRMKIVELHMLVQQQRLYEFEIADYGIQQRILNIYPRLSTRLWIISTLSSASSWSFGSTSRFGGGGGMSFDAADVSSTGLTAGSTAGSTESLDSGCSVVDEEGSVEVEFEVFEDD